MWIDVVFAAAAVVLVVVVDRAEFPVAVDCGDDKVVGVRPRMKSCFLTLFFDVFCLRWDKK